jgi:hypothetical protein
MAHLVAGWPANVSHQWWLMRTDAGRRLASTVLCMALETKRRSMVLACGQCLSQTSSGMQASSLSRAWGWNIPWQAQGLQCACGVDGDAGKILLCWSAKIKKLEKVASCRKSDEIL